MNSPNSASHRRVWTAASPRGSRWTGTCWTGPLAESNCPTSIPPLTGMLFVAPSNSDNATNIAAAAPREGGWDIAVREDNDDDVSGQTFAVANELDYQFLYVPYDSVNLVGGHVQGTDGTSLTARVTPGFH